MGKTKLRRIVVNNQSYLWKRVHLHLHESDNFDCTEELTIYLEGYKNTPLKLVFHLKTIENTDKSPKQKWSVGPDAGILSKKCKNGKWLIVNLNRPAVIARLIEYFTAKKWSPTEIYETLVVGDVLHYIEAIDLPYGLE